MESAGKRGSKTQIPGTLKVLHFSFSCIRPSYRKMGVCFPASPRLAQGFRAFSATARDGAGRAKIFRTTLPTGEGPVKVLGLGGLQTAPSLMNTPPVPKHFH